MIPDLLFLLQAIARNWRCFDLFVCSSEEFLGTTGHLHAELQLRRRIACPGEIDFESRELGSVQGTLRYRASLVDQRSNVDSIGTYVLSRGSDARRVESN
jgi:hypothetical protein